MADKPLPGLLPVKCEVPPSALALYPIDHEVTVQPARWKRLQRDKETPFAEVRISEPPVMQSAPPAEVSADVRTAGQIGIELPSGVRLTVYGAVDAEALSRVIGVLAR